MCSEEGMQRSYGITAQRNTAKIRAGLSMGVTLIPVDNLGFILWYPGVRMPIPRMLSHCPKANPNSDFLVVFNCSSLGGLLGKGGCGTEGYGHSHGVMVGWMILVAFPTLMTLWFSSPIARRSSSPGWDHSQQEKFNNSLFHQSNLLHHKAIIANGSKVLLPQLDSPCHVPLTSNSALIPALKYIMKDIQNISKWHWYWFINARECCPNWI